jgi:hypothetical protein
MSSPPISAAGAQRHRPPPAPLHPAARAGAGRAAGHRPGRRRARDRRARQALPRSHGRAVVRVAGLLRDSRLADAANAQLRTLPYYHSFSGKVPGPVTDLVAKLKRLGAHAGAEERPHAVRQLGLESNDTAFKLVRYIHNARGSRTRRRSSRARRATTASRPRRRRCRACRPCTSTSTCRCPACCACRHRTSTATPGPARAKRPSSTGWSPSSKS